MNRIATRPTAKAPAGHRPVRAAAAAARPLLTRQDLRPLLLVLAAFALARGAALALGVRVDPEQARDSWQTLPLDRLAADLPGALWGLHSQPPLWNGLLGLASMPCGAEAECVGRLIWALHVALTPAAALALYVGLRAAETRRGLAGAAAAILAASPSTIFYEALPIYAHLSLVLAAGILACLALTARRGAEDGGAGWAMLALALTALLCLTWTLFHPAFLFVTAAALLLARPSLRRDRGLRLVGALCLAAALAPSVKNAAQAGMVSNGTWLGLNLSQVAPGPRDASCSFGVILAAAAEREGLAPQALHTGRALNAPEVAAQSRVCMGRAAERILADPAGYLRGRAQALLASHQELALLYFHTPRNWTFLQECDRPQTWRAWCGPLRKLTFAGHALTILAGLALVASGGRRARLAGALLLIAAVFTGLAHAFNGGEQERMRHTIGAYYLALAAMAGEAALRLAGRRSRPRLSGSRAG